MKKNEKNLRTYPEFKRLAFHRQPHADEILAWILLCTEAAREIFPNLDIENVEWLDDNTRDYRKFPECLHIGCGRDPRFDEHARQNDEFHSSCTLVASKLGLLYHPAWKKTIEDVRREDRHGGARVGEIAWMAKSLYQAIGGTPENDMRVIRWAETAYCAEIDSGLPKGKKPLTTKTAKILLEKQNSEKLAEFLELAETARDFELARRENAKKHFLEKAKCFWIDTLDKGMVKLFMIESDNPEMAWASWKCFDGDIVILRQSSGHTQIMTAKKLLLDMTEVAFELEELETAEGADWILAGEKTMILNGSLKFTGVTPTGLTLEQIKSVVENTLCFKGGLSLVMSYVELEKVFQQKACV